MIGAGIVIVVLASFKIGQHHPLILPVEPIKEKVDTLVTEKETSVTEPEKDLSAKVVTRTIRVTFPVVDSASIRQVDSLLEKVASLERVNDSLVLVLHREQKMYQSEDYTAWVSGYDPSLDSLRIYSQEKVITREVTIPKIRKTHWGIGLSAGYGASLQGNRVVLNPVAAFTINWNFATW